MCEVAGGLEHAYGVAENALGADRAGDTERARQLASDASRLADEAKARLDAVDGDATVASDPYQALVMGYLHVGQAAKALLPEWANTHGMTAEELDLARTQLGAAEAALDGC